ncbi:MAG: YggT family protein [Actinomycetes bacterium]
MTIVWQVLYFVLWLFFMFLLARLVLDLVQLFAREYRPRGVMLIVFEVVFSVTDPPLKAIRRVIPPVRLGQVQLDLAFLVLFIVVNVTLQLVGRWAAG